MARVTDGQSDFSGGMVDRVSAELIPENAYAYGKNLEIRDGYPRTRRGSRVYFDVAGTKLQAATTYIQKNTGIEWVYLVVDGNLYRSDLLRPYEQITLPEDVENDTLQFVQAFDALYLLRGSGKDILKWSGAEADAWGYTGSTVARLDITTPGTGYVSAPDILIDGGTVETSATAHSIVSGGAVTALVLDTNGNGYTATPRVLPISGYGAVVTPYPVLVPATGGGFTRTIGGLQITNSGVGYRKPPVVIIGGTPPEVPAVFGDVVLSSDGKIVSIPVLSGGSGYLVDAFVPATVTVVDDFTATATLSKGAPPASIGTYAYNRLWLVDGYTLNVSDLLSDVFDTISSSFEINSGDGGAITAITPYGDGGLLIFKQNQVWYMTGCNGALTGLSLQLLDSRHGCVGSQALSAVGNDVWYVSDDGIRSTQLTALNQTQLVDVPVSTAVSKMWERTRAQNLATATIAVFDNYVLTALPMDSDRTNSHMIVYDLVTKSWVGEWMGIEAQHCVVTRKALFALDAGGLVLKMFADWYLDKVYGGGNWILDPVASGGDLIDLHSSKWKSLARTEIRFTFRFVVAGADSWVIIENVNNSTYRYVKLYIVAGASTYYFAGLCDVSSALQWTFENAAESRDFEWHSVRFGHDGTTPYLFIDGVEKTLTFSVSTDKTKWIGDINHYITMRLYGSGAPSRLQLKACSVVKQDTDEVLATLNTYDAIAGEVDMLHGVAAGISHEVSRATNAVWISPATDWGTSLNVEIPAELRTRAFTFGNPQLLKAFGPGELTVLHRQPTWSLTALTRNGNETSAMVSAKTYNLRATDLKNGVAWTDYYLSSFNAVGRNDAAPVILSGNSVATSLIMNGSGAVLSTEVEHTESFHVGKTDATLQLDITNTTGTLAVKTIALTASVKGLNVRRNR